MVTFDNVAEVEKMRLNLQKIQLVLRIVTDDSGSQCRLSSKFGAPKGRWRPLLKAAKRCGMEVVGVSFHVGSGCRDIGKYELALRDAKMLFDIAENEFGFKMTLLDIGGGFPGETHSLWNPVDRDPIPSEAEEDNEEEEEEEETNYMFFKDIASNVGQLIDEIFPVSSGVQVIAEPGRYLVAASCTLVCSVTSVRENALDEHFSPEPIPDDVAAISIGMKPHDLNKQPVTGFASSCFQ
jgi:ornithine decarboxylase